MFRHHRDPPSHHELPELSEGHVLAHFINPDPTVLGGAASQRSYCRSVGVAVTWLPSPRRCFHEFLLHSRVPPPNFIELHAETSGPSVCGKHASVCTSGCRICDRTVSLSLIGQSGCVDTASEITVL